MFYVPRKVSQLRTKNKQRSCVSLCFLSILILNILFLGLTVLRNGILKKALLKLPKFYPFKLTPLVFSGFRLFCVPWGVSLSLNFSGGTRKKGINLCTKKGRKIAREKLTLKDFVKTMILRWWFGLYFSRCYKWTYTAKSGNVSKKVSLFKIDNVENACLASRKRSTQKIREEDFDQSWWLSSKIVVKAIW